MHNPIQIQHTNTWEQQKIFQVQDYSQPQNVYQQQPCESQRIHQAPMRMSSQDKLIYGMIPEQEMVEVNTNYLDFAAMSADAFGAPASCSPLSPNSYTTNEKIFPNNSSDVFVNQQQFNFPSPMPQLLQLQTSMQQPMFPIHQQSNIVNDGSLVPMQQAMYSIQQQQQAQPIRVGQGHQSVGQIQVVTSPTQQFNHSFSPVQQSVVQHPGSPLANHAAQQQLHLSQLQIQSPRRVLVQSQMNQNQSMNQQTQLNQNIMQQADQNARNQQVHAITQQLQGLQQQLNQLQFQNHLAQQQMCPQQQSTQQQTSPQQQLAQQQIGSQQQQLNQLQQQIPVGVNQISFGNQVANLNQGCGMPNNQLPFMELNSQLIGRLTQPMNFQATCPTLSQTKQLFRDNSNSKFSVGSCASFGSSLDLVEPIEDASEETSTDDNVCSRSRTPPKKKRRKRRKKKKVVVEDNSSDEDSSSTSKSGASSESSESKTAKKKTSKRKMKRKGRMGARGVSVCYMMDILHIKNVSCCHCTNVKKSLDTIENSGALDQCTLSLPREDVLRRLPDPEFTGEFDWDVAEFSHYIPIFRINGRVEDIYYKKFPRTARDLDCVPSYLTTLSLNFGQIFQRLEFEQVPVHNAATCGHFHKIRDTLEHTLKKHFQYATTEEFSKLTKLIYKFVGCASQMDILKYSLQVWEANTNEAGTEFDFVVIASPFNFHVFQCISFLATDDVQDEIKNEAFNMGRTLV